MIFYIKNGQTTMEKRKLPIWKRITFSTIITLFLLLFIVLIGEGLMRGVVYMKSKKYPTRTTVADKDWGHRSLENFDWNGIVTDASGKVYNLKYSTDDRGFRAFGDVNSNKKKVFFIGDSFTQAIEASDGRTYFDHLGDSLNLEIFAYGCRGFSTLQELMVLEKYLPEIQPDAVVVQFCSNDFINNHHGLEQNSLYNNNRRRRPYLLENDSIAFNVPAKIGWDWLNERSLFFQFLFTRLERFINSQAPEDAHSEYNLKEKGIAFEPFSESVKRTEKLLKSFQEKLSPKIKFLIFPTHDDYPYFDAIGDLCHELEIPFVGHLPQEITISDEKGMNTRALDGAHWNELGHKIAAQHLACDVMEILEISDSKTTVLSLNE